MPRRSPRPDAGRGPARRRGGGRPGAGAGPDDGDRPAGPRGWQQLVSTAEGDFLVRSVPGAAAGKVYRCPGCLQEIAVGVAHVVVWPHHDGRGSGVADRRHWHGGCWDRRSRRGGPGRLPW
ncbi:hypothetical protein [Nakamurella leprariae]|uniref:ATP/GTP-binding protein n=1 Tax=Nakamurella leprariae TaxID=2803911 RepID=A0A938YI10_9ACTN|nr:hypothetical protein [Nakamurella leprariae]MBM9468170.1 hypothetical protein [Nakamurella leprariae]